MNLNQAVQQEHPRVSVRLHTERLPTCGPGFPRSPGPPGGPWMPWMLETQTHVSQSATMFITSQIGQIQIYADSDQNNCTKKVQVVSKRKSNSQ